METANHFASPFRDDDVHSALGVAAMARRSLSRRPRRNLRRKLRLQRQRLRRPNQKLPCRSCCQTVSARPAACSPHCSANTAFGCLQHRLAGRQENLLRTRQADDVKHTGSGGPAARSSPIFAIATRPGKSVKNEVSLMMWLLLEGGVRRASVENGQRTLRHAHNKATVSGSSNAAEEEHDSTSSGAESARCGYMFVRGTEMN